MEENYLTRAEEQVMQILWQIEKGFVKDILDKMPEPKPAYNTVSTIVRILESKGFIDHTPVGKSHEYYPLVAQNDYKKGYFKNFLKNYFGNSFHQLVSFFANEKDISGAEMEEMMKVLEKMQKNKKKS